MTLLMGLQIRDIQVIARQHRELVAADQVVAWQRSFINDLVKKGDRANAELADCQFQLERPRTPCGDGVLSELGALK